MQSHKIVDNTVKVSSSFLSLNALLPWQNVGKWYFVTKIVLTYCEKNCSSDREKHLKLEGEFAKILRSLEQFVRTVKGQNKIRLGQLESKLEKIIGI